MAPDKVQNKIDEMNRRGIIVTRQQSPFGVIVIGECKIGDRVVAANHLINSIDLDQAASPHHVMLEALSRVEATLGSFSGCCF
jgi:hypothetical protein